MKKFLIINASTNFQGSFSRRLSEYFIGKLNIPGHEYEICFRDLANRPIPHVSQNWIDADRKPATQRNVQDREELRMSDTLIEELRRTDIIVIASPMYNWSIPSNLKAYLDQVMRFNETFAANSQEEGIRYSGLLKNKILYLLLSRGSKGYGKGERNEQMDFQGRYLKMVFGIMGIRTIFEMAINGTNRNDQDREREFIAVQKQIDIQLKAESGNARSQDF